MKLVVAAASALLMIVSASDAAPRRQTPKAEVPSAAPLDMAHLKQWAPTIYKRWQDQVPGDFYIPSLKWLTHLEGTTSPMRHVVIDGEKVIVGGVCKPQQCRFNDVELVIAPSKVAGLAHFRDLDGNESVLTVGKLTGAQVQCLDKLYRDAGADC